MKRWCGWGERLINLLSPDFWDAVKGTRCVGAGFGTHEVVAGHLGSGRICGGWWKSWCRGGVIVDSFPAYPKAYFTNLPTDLINDELICRSKNGRDNLWQKKPSSHPTQLRQLSKQ
jgi:hypothetical protein